MCPLNFSLRRISNLNTKTAFNGNCVSVCIGTSASPKLDEFLENHLKTLSQSESSTLLLQTYSGPHLYLWINCLSLYLSVLKEFLWVRPVCSIVSLSHFLFVQWETSGRFCAGAPFNLHQCQLCLACPGPEVGLVPCPPGGRVPRKEGRQKVDTG